MPIKKPAPAKVVKTLTHEKARRRNIPTAEYEAVVEPADKSPIRIAYRRRNRDIDPQLVWRGKDEQDASDLVVQAPPLYIQEKVHPKALIDDLLRDTRDRAHEAGEIMPDLFAAFNGLPKGVDKTEFYRHDQNWSNRLILGDSLQVMVSLAEREGLRGKVQSIYVDPPYGIKFNSNFQWSTTSRDVKDGNLTQITREPEQVKAFRDTWRTGIHSYLTYLRDRLTVARDLLTDSGSIFVQIGDENVHRVRALMDEVFRDDNFVAQIAFEKTSSTSTEDMASITDHILWFAKDRSALKFRPTYKAKVLGEAGTTQYVWFDDGLGFDRRLLSEEIATNASTLDQSKVFACDNLTSQRPAQGTDVTSFLYNGSVFAPGKGTFKTDQIGLSRLAKAGRLRPIGKSLMYRRYLVDFRVVPIANYWNDVKMTGFSEEKTYIVQTSQRVIERCLLMATDPGDLVLDPTCGSGTTAAVAEQWGRRWIAIDTSRVALALARARIMGARYPYYLLADTREGQLKEAEVIGTAPSFQTTRGDIRHGFVYERVPHVTLKSIANNAEIDVIWDRWQAILEPLHDALTSATSKLWQEWEIPREVDNAWPERGESRACKVVGSASRTSARNRRVDCSQGRVRDIYTTSHMKKRRPFASQDRSPSKALARTVSWASMKTIEPIDPLDRVHAEKTFAEIILDNLKTAGVQQAHKEDKIAFTALVPWPGDYVCAEGRYLEDSNGSGKEKRAGIFIGPEFGTITRQDLVSAAREASDAGFDVLIACGFNYEAHTTEFNKLGRLPVLKARMNADLQMSSDLAKTDKANLFVVFGEPDITLSYEGANMLRVTINGVDVYHPSTGEVTSSGPNEIACWFIDTDYNEESFFVRHAYFLGANDPYDALKRSLKAEIDMDAWSSLNSDTSRAFPKPNSGRIAVKVINHLGDEVMKVFRIS